MSENEIVNLLPEDGLHGRRKIFTDAPAITAENVVDVLGKAMAVHRINRGEIEYLYNYYKGKQDIRCREKMVRPEINNKVTVNRANEIVVFKTSYLLSEPLQYISRGGDENISKKIDLLNDCMYAEDKAAKDKEVAEWAHICGVGCRMVMPDEIGEEDGSGIHIYTLDPRDAFVIYSSDLGNRPLAGVVERKDEEGNSFSCVYTASEYFEIKDGEITNRLNRTVPFVPIIEYLHNEARMGAFEAVLPLLNALNTLESNRVDDIEQFVQSILVFENCEIDKEKMEQLRQQLGLMIKSNDNQTARVYRVEGELSQSGAQTLVDDIYDTVLTITGMPNRNGGSSTSDTGAATIMRDGWQAAEARAKDTELLFSRSERAFLKIALYTLRESDKVDLKLSDIGFKFTRRNYADIQSKVQVLCEMLNNSKIHPKLAFQACGLFTDSEEAYQISKAYAEEQQAQMERTLREEVNANGNSGTESLRTGGQGDRTAE